MANSTVDTYGVTRATQELYNLPQGGEVPRVYNNRGDMGVSQSLPSKAELVRLGNTWEVRMLTAAPFTTVLAMPTTLAVLALYNGEAVGGRSYVIDTVWSFNQATSAAAEQMALICILLPSLAAITHDATQFCNSRSGRPNYTGKAKWAVNQTMTGGTDLWSVLQSSNPTSASASKGFATVAEVNGGWIVPPGATFGVNVIAGVAAASSIMGIVWHEVQLALG